jgi:lipopolysaccharide transport system ATP-binding protein
MESDEILVKVEGLSKKFCKSLKKSLKYGMYDLVANLRGKDTSNALRPDEFWALKDINFELKRGECLGLIGHNGAGKSTLLKILNGLINPDHGKVTIRGRVGALIELGAGFNPIMTGRENIYNNGAVLGFTREEINAKIEEIIAFSELEEFIDMPVRNYSSGMKVRLGFSVAAQMEPDVLIIDEVLAVGDVGFRIKCLNRIGELLKNTAVIFVSHSMVQIAKISTKYVLLDKGQSVLEGADMGQGVQAYFKKFKNKEDSNKSEGSLIIESFSLNGNKEGIKHMQDFNLQLNFDNNATEEIFSLDIGFADKEMKAIAITYIRAIEIKKGKSTKIIVIKNLPLTNGNYMMNISLRYKEHQGREGKVISFYRNICDFDVKGGNINKFCPVQLTGEVIT